MPAPPALSIILSHLGRHRAAGGIARFVRVCATASKASNILKAAKEHGLVGRGVLQGSGRNCARCQCPLSFSGHFNHFLVVEGFGKGKVFLNDPPADRDR